MEGSTNINAGGDSFREQRMPKYKQIIRLLWRLVFGGLAVIILWFAGLIFFGDLPSFEQLENPEMNDATTVFSADNVELGRYYVENRVRVHQDSLSDYLYQALVATEDERFYDHCGIDGRALARVAVRTIILRNSTGGGGSTVTQQLAKLLFKRRSLGGNPIIKVWRLVNIKFKEWITAVRLERRYTKREIIAMYLNQFNFINGAFGVQAASEIYFGTNPKDLKLEEAAVLVGMLKNPSMFNPRRFPERVKGRRNQVFIQMKKNGLLTTAEKDSLSALPLDMSKFSKKDHNDGLAPYFRERLREEVKRLLKEDAEKKSNGDHYNIYTDGLKIYTTIDSRLQGYAEKAAAGHLGNYLQPIFFKHWKNLDPWEHGYAAGSTQRKIRENALKKMVRNTERFDNLRGKYLKRIDELELRDVDVTRMFQIEEDGWMLADDWLDKGFINKKLYALYQSVLGRNMKGEDWKIVKNEWNKLNKAADVQFKKPVQMKVFGYTPSGEIDTLMSPYDSLRYHRMILQVGMMGVEPQTGHIKVWVGGPDHKYFKYDHVNRGNMRQVGSTFKPFLYATHVGMGVSPCKKYLDVKTVIESGEGSFNLYRPWIPKNSGGTYSGIDMTLQEALKKSVNSVSAKLMKELGTTKPVRDMVDKMGIDLARVPASPSIALGAADLSVYEMVGAYTSFANKGEFIKPTFIERIEDKNGNVIWESGVEISQPMNETTAYTMIKMLQGAKGGGFAGTKSEVGGKTGTTNSHADGWFMGVTPNLVLGTWVGGDDRWIRFRDIRYGQGARMAKPIFIRFLKAAEKDKKAFDATAKFETPLGYNITWDCSKYQSDIPDGLDDFDEYGPVVDSTGTIIDGDGDFGDF